MNKAEKLRGITAALLIEVAVEEKGKMVSKLDFQELIDVVHKIKTDFANEQLEVSDEEIEEFTKALVKTKAEHKEAIIIAKAILQLIKNRLKDEMD